MAKKRPDGEMVDTIDSKSVAFRRGGSIPLQGKMQKKQKENLSLFNKVVPNKYKEFFICIIDLINQNQSILIFSCEKANPRIFQ